MDEKEGKFILFSKEEKFEKFSKEEIEKQQIRNKMHYHCNDITDLLIDINKVMNKLNYFGIVHNDSFLLQDDISDQLMQIEITIQEHLDKIREQYVVQRLNESLNEKMKKCQKD